MTEEKKESKSTDEHINLKVLGQDNNVVQFKIKKGTPLRKLMNAYCERCNLSMSTVRFRFDGQAINEQDTPSTLEMEEGDTIEIYQQQTGGFKQTPQLQIWHTESNMLDPSLQSKY
ncbi:small ubiquitin-related modifier 3 [Diaphorina citri]|uniref:Small ubiquitin-related modifier n=1 Tax=Diaphorina citri TaxID=121845 RepID=A0A1S3D9K3_DIACI|nr:small ubiquitin-related modifier 3 [Diaphorina citri]